MFMNMFGYLKVNLGGKSYKLSNKLLNYVLIDNNDVIIKWEIKEKFLVLY